MNSLSLLLLVSGNASAIMESHHLDASTVQIVKIDDKDLSRPQYILELIRQAQPAEIFFGCGSFAMQRFQPFMLLYIVLSGVGKGAILSAESEKHRFTYIDTLLRAFPLLIAEVIVSIGIVALWSPYLWVLHRLFVPSHARSMSKRKGESS